MAIAERLGTGMVRDYINNEICSGPNESIRWGLPEGNLLDARSNRRFLETTAFYMTESLMDRYCFFPWTLCLV